MEQESTLNRRSFIRHSVMAAAAPAVLGLGGQAIAEKDFPVNFGVIGTGGRGRQLLGSKSRKLTAITKDCSNRKTSTP